MAELFRLKITSDNDVVLPTRLVSLLHLVEGDELQLQVNDDKSLSIEKVSARAVGNGPDANTLIELKRRADIPGSADLAKKFLSKSRSEPRVAAAKARGAGGTG